MTSSADPLDGKVRSYAYSALGQLIGDGVASGGTPITSMWCVNGAYEIGQRVDPSGPFTSTLTYDPAHEVTGLTATAGAATTASLPFAYDAAGDRTAQYALRDRLGSTRALLDGAGATAATYSYDPYGAVVSRAGGATTPFGFAGEYTDAESGLQYLRARYYDPQTQQFLSVDPLVGQTGQPYAYVGDDPLNGFDPTGLAGCNGASGRDAWAWLGSSVGDLGCNFGEIKATLLTGRANGTTTGMVNEATSVVLGPATVTGGPSGPCDLAAYDARADRDQRDLDREGRDAAVASLALGGASLARGVTGLAGGLRGATAGTVWDSIVATQPVYEGTVLPRSFELTTSTGRFWAMATQLSTSLSTR